MQALWRSLCHWLEQRPHKTWADRSSPLRLCPGVLVGVLVGGELDDVLRPKRVSEPWKERHSPTKVAQGARW